MFDGQSDCTARLLFILMHKVAMMKHLFLILGFLLSATVFAQGDSPGCSSACFTVTDGSCAPNGHCGNWTSAQSITFTAPCTGVFDLWCKTDCQNCYACGACARLVNLSSGSTISNCRSTLDGWSCEWPCDNKAYDSRPSLVSGTQYRLDVMLQRCPTAQSCAQCGDCVAKARVFHVDADCTPW